MLLGVKQKNTGRVLPPSRPAPLAPVHLPLYIRNRCVRCHRAENQAAAVLLIVSFICIGGMIPSIELAAVGSGLYPALSSVMCSRLIFSLYMFSTPEERLAGTFSITVTPSGVFKPGIPMTTFQAINPAPAEPEGGGDNGHMV
ncbi:hypothetical protein FRC08_011184 [Ceratobasidium sp. 394]|nr:hypothetical protein FRC08_011184 [Ceratobasidium sp. 394]